MAGLFNSISGFKVKEYTAIQKQADTEDSTNYKDVDFSLNFASTKTVLNSGLASSLASIADDDYKKDKENDDKDFELEKETLEQEEYKITEKYKENEESDGFDSES